MGRFVLLHWMNVQIGKAAALVGCGAVLAGLIGWGGASAVVHADDVHSTHMPRHVDDARGDFPSAAFEEEAGLTTLSLTEAWMMKHIQPDPAVAPRDLATDPTHKLAPNEYLAIAHIPAPTAVTGGFALLIGIAAFRHYVRRHR